MPLTRAGLFLLLIAQWLVAAEPAVRVTCPAISYDDHNDRGRNGPDGANPVVLMVKARTIVPAANRVKGKRQPNDEYREIEQVDLEIEQVLFGPSPGKTIRVDSSYVGATFLEEPQSRIFSLSIGRDGKYSLDTYYAYDRTMELADEQAAIALARARLDYHVLGSTEVFVGSPVPATDLKKPKVDLFDSEDESYPKVRVERVLAGSLKAGEEIDIKPADPLPELRSQRGPFIYLSDDRSPGYLDEKLRVYEVRLHWPLSMLDTVQAALARRGNYPIEKVTDEDGNTRVHQEILFLGPRADAIAMIGTDNKAVRYLVSQRLMHDGLAALPDVRAAIEKHLWSDASEPEQTFRQQKMLIDGMAALEERRTDGEVVRLIDLILTKAEAGATFPPRKEAVDPRARFRNYNELDEASNHSLAWLLMTQSGSDVAKHFGTRLLKLRDVAAYGWKDEAQFVLDAMHIEDHLECAPLLAKANRVQSVHWQGGFDAGAVNNYRAAISPEGHYLAAVTSSDVRVWNRADLRVVAQWEQPSGSAAAICFSPDSKFLYIGGGYRKVALERWDWQNRRRDMQYLGLPSGVGGMHLTPDGNELWACDNLGQERPTFVYDPNSGKLLRKVTLGNWDELRLNRDGTHALMKQLREWRLVDLKSPSDAQALPFDPIDVVWASGNEFWSLEEGTAIPSPANPSRVPAPKLAAGDDPFGPPTKPPELLPVAAPDPFGTELPSLLRLRKLGALQSESRTIKLSFEAKKLLASRDARTVLALRDHQVAVIALPEGKLTCWQLPPSRQSGIVDRKFELSGDGRTLVAADGYGVPGLFDASTGEALPKGGTHVGRIRQLEFSANGEELLSLDERGVQCRWKVESGQLIDRKSLGEVHFADERRSSAEFDEHGEKWNFLSRRIIHPYYGPISLEVRVGDPTKDSSDDEKYGKLIGKVEPRWGHDQPIALVPGGKYLHVGAHIYTRSDMKLVSAQNVSGHIRRMTFNPDGSRYALLTEESDFRPSPLGMDIQQRHVISQNLRIHDTMTGKPVFCQPVGQDVQLIALSPDGRKVAGVNKRQEIAVWTVGK